jgi:hypothetical protein
MGKKVKMVQGLMDTVPDPISTVDTSDWFESIRSTQAGIELPESNEDYFYCAAKLCSEWPYVTQNATTYEPEDLSEDVLASLIGVQVNLRHDRVRQVVGTVVKAVKVDGGIEIVVRVDRVQAAAHNLDPEDMKPGNIYGSVSLEVSKDAKNSFFYVIDEGFNILKKIPRLDGEKLGIRRTRDSEANPYRFQGNRVIERIKPIRFTGVGFVPDPADQTAQVYAVAADTTTPERLITMPAPKTAAELAAHTLSTAVEAKGGEYKDGVQEPNAQHQVHMEPNEHPEYMDIHASDADAMHELACGYM